MELIPYGRIKREKLDPWFTLFQTLSCISESVFSLQLELLAAGLGGIAPYKELGWCEWHILFPTAVSMCTVQISLPRPLLMVHTFAFRHCLPPLPKERAGAQTMSLCQKSQE